MKNYEKYKDLVICGVKENSVCKLAGKAYGTDICSNRECSDCRERVAEWLDKEYKRQIDWSKVPVDTPVICTDYSGEKYHRHFSKVDGCNVPFAFYDGKTSWTSGSGYGSSWTEMELAREEDVEKYSI